MVLDTLPIFEWKLFFDSLKGPLPSDRDLAQYYLGNNDFAYAQSFSQLRSAIAFLFQNETLKAPTVLLPRFLCPSVSEAVESQGYQVLEVDTVEGKGTLNLQVLLRMNLEKVGAIVSVHPFGIPTKGDELAVLAQKNGILLVEDFAHCAAPLQNKPRSAYQLFHFAKRFASFNGGLLVSREKRLPSLTKTAKLNKFECFQLFSQMHFFRPLLNRVRRHRPLPNKNKTETKTFLNFEAAHPWAKRLAYHMFKEEEKTKTKRLKLRESYLAFLGPEFSPLCKDPEVDLLHFPVLIPEHWDRNDILLKLRKKGIFLDRLWYNSSDPLGRKIVVLPLHHRMEDPDVQCLVRELYV